MKIIGIDPSLRRTGWGMVKIDKYGKIQHLDHGVIIIDTKNSMEIRLGMLQENVENLIDANKPDLICIEETYCGVNGSTTIKLGFVCGAILAAAGRKNLQVLMYPTRIVKQHISGKGSDSKEQVRDQIQEMFNIKISALDASDALAVAIAHSMLFLKNE